MVWHSHVAGFLRHPHSDFRDQFDKLVFRFRASTTSLPNTDVLHEIASKTLLITHVLHEIASGTLLTTTHDQTVR